MSASPKMRSSISNPINTRASISHSFHGTYSGTTYVQNRAIVLTHKLTGQWTAFVELLPLWLAPNMVTLLGFVFILVNVGLLEMFIPDLVGPVCYLKLR